MSLRAIPIRIGGREYTLRLTSQRQIVQGAEQLYVIDHEQREIRLGLPVRRLLAEAVSAARRTMPVAVILSLVQMAMNEYLQFASF